MRVRELHPWSLAPPEARRIQSQLAERIVQRWGAGRPKTVAGCDVHFPSRDCARASVVVMAFPEMRILEQAVSEAPCHFPYVPGLLSFRELPVLIPLFEKLRISPDLVLCDGQGIAHPRRIGLASHLGLVLAAPTIGCAKSRLVGEHEALDQARGSTTPLYGRDGEVLGSVVRTRNNTKPLYVSVGHLVTLRRAVRIVLRCSPRYRIPEPLRMAHRLAGQRL